MADSDNSPPPSPKPKRKKNQIVIDHSNTNYPIVKESAESLGWAEAEGEGDNWTVFWIDTSIAPDRLMRMKPYQVRVHICNKFFIDSFLLFD